MEEILNINAQIQIQKQKLKELEDTEFLLKHKKKMALLETELVVLEKVREELCDVVTEIEAELDSLEKPSTLEEKKYFAKVSERYKSEVNKLKTLIKKIDTKRLEQAISSKTLEMFK